MLGLGVDANVSQVSVEGDGSSGLDPDIRHHLLKREEASAKVPGRNGSLECPRLLTELTPDRLASLDSPKWKGRRPD